MSTVTWSERWLGFLNKLGYEPYLRYGRSYAKRKQVNALEVQVGRVTAQVEDRDLGLCDIAITINRLSDEEWQRVLDVLSQQAIYVAQLLAGDMPTNIDELFQQAGVSLLPGGSYDIEIHCENCEESGQPCKHSAAVLYLLGDMLDDDPWLLFRLRGRDRHQVLQAMRQRRSKSEDLTPTTAHVRQPAEQSIIGSLNRADETHMPLGAQIDTFWGTSKKLSALYHHIAPPSIKLALLRRLGPPPFPTDSIETYEQLGQIYQEVTENALALAYALEPDGS